MTVPNGDSTTPPAPASTERGAEAAEAYAEANLDRFTPDALVAALVASGHEREGAKAAVRQASARRGAAPARATARRGVLLAYGLTYLVLMLALIGLPSRYGGGQIGAVILTVVLGLALAISWWWVRRRRGSATLGAMLGLPIVLLVIVGGTCALALPGLVQMP
jgi:cytochrome bd-type quinol oxidase subunit 2